MWPFKHNHDWQLLFIKSGPWEEGDGSVIKWKTCNNYWCWICQGCRKFKLNIGGEANISITGEIPENKFSLVVWQSYILNILKKEVNFNEFDNGYRFAPQAVSKSDDSQGLEDWTPTI